MGDKEAARVILEEVAANGSEAQQAEAQKMLDLL
jgi:FimV-like protein